MTLMTLLMLFLLFVPQEKALPDAAALLARLEKEKRPVWVDGSTLSFVYRGEADQVSVMMGGELLAMQRLPQSEVWLARKTVQNVSSGFFSYAFLPSKAGQRMAGPMNVEEWRGPDAPSAVKVATTLQGKVTEHELDSQALGMKRKITVYQPPAGLSSERPHVLYMADGQGASGFAHLVEPLILEKKIPPTVIIGVHNGNQPRPAPMKDGEAYDPRKDNRAREYLPTVDPEHFRKHEEFFCHEVLPWAEHHFRVSRQRAQRGVYGQSNSGRFAYCMGIRHPELFGQVFAFSLAGRHEAVPTLSCLPMFHLTAGTWEEVFLNLTQTAARELAAKEVPVCMVTHHAGHDTALWKHELAQALPRAWGKTPAPVFDETKLPFPFRRFTTTDRYGRTVTAYLSYPPAKAADGDAQKLPLVLWITGSGSQSLFHKTPSGQIAGGLQNLLHQAAKGRYRVLCVEKPGVNYLDWPKQPGSAQEASEEFRREHTLPRWAEANAAALRAAWQIPEIDRSRTLVLGHSEGALTASRVAAKVPEVTHVAPLASAGATQLHGLVEFAAERAKTAEEGNLLRDKAYEEWRKIMARPEAIDQFWMGHPYRRWSSFCRHNSVNELLRSSARIYLAQGTADKSSHISELDLLRAELAVHGRDAVVERIVGVDHGYRPAGKEQAPGPPVELMALFERIVEWYLR